MWINPSEDITIFPRNFMIQINKCCTEVSGLLTPCTDYNAIFFLEGRIRVGSGSFLLNEIENCGEGIVRRLVGDRHGVTAIEYGLIAALIAVAAVGIMTTVGGNLSSTFSDIASNL
jgi:pilus assembly protein Flp/PilA